jgi:cytochrome c-type biogenesis protein CcmE
MKRSLALGALLAAGAGVLCLVSWLTRPTLVYSVRVSDFLARGPWDRTVRIQGQLVPGTLCRIDAKCGYRFRMTDVSPFTGGGTTAPAPHELAVRYDACVVPDTVRDIPGFDIEMIVEGTRCRHCHDFEASQIMAKCPSKYQMKWDAGAYGFAAKPLPRCSSLVPRM